MWRTLTLRWICMAALAVLISPAPAWSAVRKTELSPPQVVRVADLIGLTPAEAQARLTGLPDAWPKVLGLEMATPHGVLSFAAVDEWRALAYSQASPRLPAKPGR